MSRSWRGNQWHVRVSSAGIEGHGQGGRVQVPAAELDRLTVRRRWWRWQLERDGQRLVRLRGLSRREAEELAQEVRRALVTPMVDAAVSWFLQVDEVLNEHVKGQRWIPRERVDELVAARPERGLLAEVTRLGLTDVIGDPQRRALAAVDRDLAGIVAERNELIAEGELRDRAEFFSSVERSPLTEEQARAVIWAPL